MTTAGQRIVTNSAILVFAEIFRKMIRILLVVFAARLLGDTNYGKFSFALAFTSLFSMFADIGIHQLIIRELARKPEKVRQYLGNAIFIKFLLIVINFSLILIVIHFMRKPYDVFITVLIMASSFIVGSFVELFKAVFQAFQRMKYDATATMITCITVTGIGISILLLGGDIRALAMAYLIANVITLLYCMSIITKKFASLSVQINMPLIQYFIRQGLPFGINFFFSTMYTYVDSIMLSVMLTDQIVGWYSASNRLIIALMLIGAGVKKALFPALSKFYTESRKNFDNLFHKAIKVMFYIGFSLAVLVTLTSRKIILFLYGAEYINSVVILQILIWSVTIAFLNNILTHTTCSANRQGFTAKVIAFSAFLNLGLNYILIRQLGYTGAAIATLITQGSTFLFHYVYLSLKLIRPKIVQLVPKLLLINVVMGAFIFYFIRFHVVLLILAAFVVNLLMVYLTRYFTIDEWTIVRRVVKFSRKPG